MAKLKLPLNYGKVETLNIDNINSNTRLGIVIPTFCRSDYVKQCLESLSASKLKNCILCIVDESLATPQFKPIEGFTIFPNVDSGGLDIGQISPVTQNFEQIIRNIKPCVAVNSGGWMKYSINPNPTWMMCSHFYTYISNDYLKAYPEINARYREKVFSYDDKTPELIHDFRHPNIPIIKIFKSVYGNMYDSIRVGFDMLSQFTDMFVVLDSDTVQKPGWLDTLYDTYQILLSTYKESPVILSGFHTTEHPTVKVYSNYRIKASLGGCNMCMDSATYELVVRKTLTDVGWDHSIKKYMATYNGILAATKPSVVQHVGKTGLWTSPTRFDSAKDF